MPVRTLQQRAFENPQPDSQRRARILRHVLAHGAAWEMSSGKSIDVFINLVKSKKHFKQKRLGTRAVKKEELLQDVGDKLNEEQATADRALAARANYLSLDRPDLSFAANELCKQFSHLHHLLSLP